MMKQEFEALAGYEVTDEAYYTIIEPMYMATNLTKKAFVKVLDKKAFALPTKGELKRAMRKIANEIWQNCGLTSFITEDDELNRIAREYARRFYGVQGNGNDYVIITRDYAYCGVRQDRGCTFPEAVVIGRGDIELERIILVA